MDITDRKEIENAVRRANDRLNFLFSSGPGVIFTCKPWGALQTTFISESVTRLLGYEPAACVSDPNFWVDRLHPDEREGVLDLVTGLADGHGHRIADVEGMPGGENLARRRRHGPAIAERNRHDAG